MEKSRSSLVNQLAVAFKIRGTYNTAGSLRVGLYARAEIDIFLCTGNFLVVYTGG